jgi:hypothetical protein
MNNMSSPVTGESFLYADGKKDMTTPGIITMNARKNYYPNPAVRIVIAST